MTPTKATLTRKRNSLIYTEMQLMYTRLTGEAPPVNSDWYQKWMKQTRRYLTPILVEKERIKTK